MKTYVVYDHPEDHPENYVVRVWNIVEGSLDPVPDQDAFIISTNLDWIRERLSIDMGLFCIPRDKSDDTCIVETWI